MKPPINPIIVNGVVLWTPPSTEHALVLAAPLTAGAGGGADAPVLEFALLVPTDLTETHGIDITQVRLEEMVASYDPAIEMASLNFDHNYGGPSLGWCEKVWMQDDSLWVRYVDLAQDAVDGVRSKAYTRRSAEIALDHPVTGGWYLTGAALLGNKRPAIPGLPPVTLCRSTYVLTTSPKEDPMPTPPPPPANPAAVADPTPPAAPATTSAPAATPPAATATTTQAESGTAELAALRSQVEQGAGMIAQLRRDRAVLDTERRLSALGNRLTPAMRTLAAPLLVELLASATPVTVQLLGADPAKAATAVPVADRVLEILAAAPAFEALGGGRLAEADPPSGTTSTLAPEREAELASRYGYKTRAFGFRAN
jgi:hypothetical protein